MNTKLLDKVGHVTILPIALWLAITGCYVTNSYTHDLHKLAETIKSQLEDLHDGLHKKKPIKHKFMFVTTVKRDRRKHKR